MEDWKGGSRGRRLCIHIADSCCCTAENNTTLESNYPPIKKERKEGREGGREGGRKEKKKERNAGSTLDL